jgi:DNA-binding XRE family transcriptional regulator
MVDAKNIELNIDKFAEIISLYRINHTKQSLRQAALSIGISAPTLNRIESRKVIPDLMTYYKLCKWCRYGMEQFFIEKKKNTNDWRKR